MRRISFDIYQKCNIVESAHRLRIQEINIYDFLDQREIYVVEANIRNINLTNYYLKISI